MPYYIINKEHYGLQGNKTQHCIKFRMCLFIGFVIPEYKWRMLILKLFGNKTIVVTEYKAGKIVLKVDKTVVKYF